ncbi:hypothetical protein [Rufibacter sp. XAAS-G3-1]|uniref:hypothetical protein n=1 Tax=Rufibacter sp. XAAS-G3-1 TaxID=2729134 RepID=UPI0015E75D1D|nr:hypothetical protein [Rufibacter sp. XAAS-G3-1]
MLEHSLFHFHKLPPWTQAELLEQKAIALSQRRFNGWDITLFSFENHFLEVWAKMGVEVVGSFHAAATYMEIIEPYMSDLSVPEGA